jgi:hypothetical protein
MTLCTSSITSWSLQCSWSLQLMYVKGCATCMKGVSSIETWRLLTFLWTKITYVTYSFWCFICDTPLLFRRKWGDMAGSSEKSTYCCCTSCSFAYHLFWTWGHLYSKIMLLFVNSWHNKITYYIIYAVCFSRSWKWQILVWLGSRIKEVSWQLKLEHTYGTPLFSGDKTDFS